MLVPTKNLKDFEKYGFKKCKGEYGDCYYLCVALDAKIIFLSKALIDVMDWRDDDPRINDKPNCDFDDTRDSLEIMVDLASKGMIKPMKAD